MNASDLSEPLRAVNPPIGSQWRLIRDVERDGKIAASADAYGVITEATDEIVVFRLEGRVVGEKYVPAEEGEVVFIRWTPLEAGAREWPTPALTFLEDAIPVATFAQKEAIQRHSETRFKTGNFELSRVHPVSLLFPFSPEAALPFDSLCIEFHYRLRGDDGSDPEGQEVVVFGNDGTVLEKVNFG